MPNREAYTRAQPRWIALALIVLTLAVFYPSIQFDYVKLDDDQYVANNPHVASGLTWNNVRWAFTTAYEGWWLPALWISYMADTEFLGHRPFSYHITNWILHATNVALLFWVLFRYTGSRWRSAFVAALFALHPTRVEAVVWITSRKDVLSGLFFMLSLLAYKRYVEQPDRARYLHVIAAMLAGLMSKAILIVLPPLLLLLDCWPLRRIALPWGRGSGSAWRPLVIEKIPLFTLALLFALIGLRTHSADTGAATDVTWLTRGGLLVTNVWDYVRLTLWPANLSLIYPEYDVVNGTFAVLVGFALLVVSVIAALQVRQRPYLLVGWFWFLVALLPILRGIRFGLAAYADRYTYLPIIGVGLIIAWSAGEWVQRRPAVRPFAVGLATAILVACVWQVHAYLPRWIDSASMFSHLIQRAPDHHLANNNYGKVLMEQGHLEEAVPYFARAAALKPDSSLAVANHGDALMRLNRNEEAIAVLRAGLNRRDVHLVNVHAVLGLAHLNLNRADEALPHLELAVRAHPHRVGWRIELLRAYLEADRQIDAVEQNRLLQAAGFPPLQSYDQLYPYYAQVWRQGEDLHAWHFFRNAMERHEPTPDLLSGVAWLIATDPTPPVPVAEALTLARHAVTLSGTPDARLVDVLAAAYAANGQYDHAQQMALRALQRAQETGQRELALQITRRLEVYRNRQPWRE